MGNVFFGIGSNLGDREHNLKEAVLRLEEAFGAIQRTSSIWETEPWGFQSDLNFLNMVVRIKTSLLPAKVLKIILKIEQQMGRVRGSRGYESRVIDIDLLLFGNIIINDRKLKVPHPHLHERKFVLCPLKEIEPDLVHPVFGKSISVLLAECIDTGIVLKR